LIGETAIAPEQFNTRYRGLFDGLTNPTAAQQERMKRYLPLDPSKFFARGSDKNSFTIPSTVSVREIQGLHDLYFVFKNYTGDKKDALFPLSEIVMMPVGLDRKLP
jgi:hypothetical protein